MLKVLKYLKKTPISVIVIIILLCVQAMADLALPDYTSKIVNIRYTTRRSRRNFSRSNKKITNG